MNSLNELLSVRTVFAFMSISIVASGVDFIINRDNAYVMESDLLPQQHVASSMSKREGVTNTLNAYIQFDEVQPITKQPESILVSNEPGMSAAKQDKQHGLLAKLYLGDDIYQLNALVKRQQISAVLSVISTLNDNTASKLLTLQLGDSLGPYLVTKINHRRVELTAGNRIVWLALFVPQSVSADIDSAPVDILPLP